MREIIVSRHPATVAYLRDALGWPESEVPAVASVAATDVRDAVVAGNLPLHLAALAAEVIAVEFTGDPPRGAEYTREDMERAGVRLARYHVRALDAGGVPTAAPTAPVLLWERRSTNGRWGVQIIGAAEDKPRFTARFDATIVAPGDLTALGMAAGRTVFRYDPCAQGFVVIAGDAEPLADTPAVTVHREGLQSGNYATLLACLPGARWQEWGYKRRSSHYCELRADGSTVDVPAGIILAERGMMPYYA